MRKPVRKECFSLRKLVVCAVSAAIIAVAAITMTPGTSKTVEPSTVPTSNETRKKALALGLINQSPETEERHVFVSEHALGPGRNGDVPVHIMLRRQEGSNWELVGTGARLGMFPNVVITAHHVMEGIPGQYGIRTVGPNEFTGTEKILPIVHCVHEGQGDDNICCIIDAERVDFPVIHVPKLAGMFDYVGEVTTKVWPYEHKIRFSTYPEKEISGLFALEVQPSVLHVFFDWRPMPGESGTTASIEGTASNLYLIVIGARKIEKELYEMLTKALPPETVKNLNWSEEKIYGVGNLIPMTPK